MAWLDRHKPVRRQFTRPRREKPSGAIVVHTAEVVADDSRSDLGAENVARFIQNRSTPGSYHYIVDSDSRINLVDLSSEAYGESTGGNRWAMHISFACTATQWGLLSPEWKSQAIMQAALCVKDINAFLRDNEIAVPPLKQISQFDYRARKAGFIAHGDVDPDRRSDPGPLFPWQDLFNQIRQQSQNVMLEDDVSTMIVASYIRGGRNPSINEHHAWLVDCTKKLMQGKSLTETMKFIEWSVRNE